MKLEKRLDETPKFIPIYDPVLREKDRRYQQGKVHPQSGDSDEFCSIKIEEIWDLESISTGNSQELRQRG